MALRSGYKGFKKLINGLKVLRPGVLGIDIGTGLAIGQDGKLNVDLTVTTGNITFETGVDVFRKNEIPYKKYGKVCVIDIDITGVEGQQNDWIVIGQAPTGFRPTANLLSNINCLSGQKIGQCQIFQDGNIRVKCIDAAIASTDIIHINGVYIV